MMDRYDNEFFSVPMNERVGTKFIVCADSLYAGLSQLRDSKRGKYFAKTVAIKSAIEELIKLWQEYSVTVKAYPVSESLRQDYHFAKNRYDNMRQNPDDFRMNEERRRHDLELERDALLKKIKNQEIEFARAEDNKRHYIRDEQARLKAALDVLNSKKARLERKDRNPTVLCCIPLTAERIARDLQALQQEITAIKFQLENLTHLKRASLEDRRYQLNLLHQRRWDIDKSLQKVNRWQTAVDNAEVVMMVRRMNIDDAAERYYANVPSHLIHAFLKVYGLFSDIINLVPNLSNEMRDYYDQMQRFAEKIYCPYINYRSVVTLYAALQALNDDDKNQVLLHETVIDHLPPVLLRALSVKHLDKQNPSISLFRKISPNQNNNQGDIHEVASKQKNK